MDGMLQLYEILKSLESGLDIILDEFTSFCLFFLLSCSSSQQNRLLAILLIFQNTPQARKWMLNGGMMKQGGIPALEFDFFIYG